MKKSLVYLAGASLVLAVGAQQAAADTVTASPSTLSAAPASTSAQVVAQLVNGQPCLVLSNLVSETETSQIRATVRSQNGQAHTYNMVPQADGSYAAYLDGAFHNFDSSQFSAQINLIKADGQAETLASYSFEWMQEVTVEAEQPVQEEALAASQSVPSEGSENEETEAAASDQTVASSAPTAPIAETDQGQTADEKNSSADETAVPSSDLPASDLVPAPALSQPVPSSKENHDSVRSPFAADSQVKGREEAAAEPETAAAVQQAIINSPTTTAQYQSQAQVEPAITGKIAVQNQNNQLGTFDVVVSDIKSSRGLNGILIPVWSENGGQDDLKWYTAAKQADDTYMVKVSASEHKNSWGLYYAHLYYILGDGSVTGVGGTQTVLAKAEPKISGKITVQNRNDQAGTFDVLISDVESSAGLQAVKVPVWSDTGGQDDLRWYTAAKQADGTYTVNVKSSDHKNNLGLYHIHLYYTLGDGSLRGVGAASVNLTKVEPTVRGKIAVQNKNEQAGTFDLVISDVESSAGLQAVNVPVWSDISGQDDLRWYTAAKQADGTYIVSVKSSDHKYSTGLYHAHLYYTLGDGSLKGVGGTATELPKVNRGDLQIVNKNDQTGSFDVVVSNIQTTGDLRDVLVPVWSEAGGQDDLQWYTAARQADGSYTVNVKASQHKHTVGDYHIHLYYRLADNSLNAIASTQTKVAISQEASVSVTNVNHQAGTFDVVVANLKSSQGVKAIQVPVWSEVDGQDDLQWYTAEEQADGTYKVSVKASSHKYNGGLYHVHAYMVQGDDSRTGVGVASLELNYEGKRRSRTIFIDPGHGGTDPGAVYSGVREKDLALSVANKLKDKLQANGYTVIMSRTGDQSVDFTRERSRLANSSNADLFVSLHFNATGAGTTTANGIETYWYQYYPEYQPSINQAMHNDPTRLAESKVLAEAVQQNLVGTTGAANRGVKRATFAVLRETALPAVLVEMGFMDNASDLAKITRDDYQEKLAAGLANGIMSWYGSVGGSTVSATRAADSSGVSVLSNLSSQQSQFLSSIYSSIKQTARDNSLLPSVMAAQAILESGWGQSKLASTPYHNLFGIKAGSDWTGSSETFTTKEFVNGQYAETKAVFRTYPSWAQSIADYGKFFTSTAWRVQNYAKYREARDYKTALAALQSSGYATDPSYASKLTALIERHGLDRWDS